MVLFVFSCQFLLYHLAFCWASSWFTLLKTPYMPPVHLTQFPIVFTCDLLHCVFFFLSCVGVSILTSRTWGLQSKKLTNSKLMHPWRKAFFSLPQFISFFLLVRLIKITILLFCPSLSDFFWIVFVRVSSTYFLVFPFVSPIIDPLCPEFLALALFSFGNLWLLWPFFSPDLIKRGFTLVE